MRQTKAGNDQSPITHLPNVAQVLQKIFDERLRGSGFACPKILPPLAFRKFLNRLFKCFCN
jgi:hypothetical protein